MSDSLLGGDVCTANDLLCIKKCRSQKIRSTRYYSFSVLGVSIILCVGGFIMLLALFLEDIAKSMSKLRTFRDSKFFYATLEWQANSTLQLQRPAHENLGIGTWAKGAESIPIIKETEPLGLLDIRDRKHPRLVHPGQMATEELAADKVDIYPDNYEHGEFSRSDFPSPSASNQESLLPRKHRHVPEHSDIELNSMDIDQYLGPNALPSSTYTRLTSAERY